MEVNGQKIILVADVLCEKFDFFAYRYFEKKQLLKY